MIFRVTRWLWWPLAVLVVDFLDDFEVVRVILINFFAQFQQFSQSFLEKNEATPKKKN